jgi:hypothetical protein
MQESEEQGEPEESGIIMIPGTERNESVNHW